MPIEIQSCQRFGPLVFGRSTIADGTEEFGQPRKTSTNRSGVIQYEYADFILRFDPSTKRFQEATLLPRCQANIDGIEVTWDKAFLKAICREVGQAYDVYGFIVLPELGIAVTGIHDDDASQLAVTIFQQGAFDELIPKGDTFDPARL